MPYEFLVLPKSKYMTQYMTDALTAFAKEEYRIDVFNCALVFVVGKTFLA